MAVFTGCSLNEDLTSRGLADNYYKSAVQIRTGLNGCYVPARSVFASIGYWEMTEVACDCINMSSQSQYNANCDVSPSRPGIGSQVWQYGYTGVMRSNEMCVMIDRALKEKNITEEEYKPLYGEAVVLRSLYYYVLTCTFGNVPFYTERVTDTNRVAISRLPRMSADSTRAQLCKELHRVILEEGYLPMRRAYEDGTDYYAGAALGLILGGKMCMWNKDWDGAEEFLLALENIYNQGAPFANGEDFGMRYPLSDIPFSKKYTKESIFEINNQVDAYGNQTSGLIASYTMPRREKFEGGSTSYDEEETEKITGDIYNGIRIPELGALARVSGGCYVNKYYYSALMPFNSGDRRAGEYSSYDASGNLTSTPAQGSGNLAWAWIGYEPKDTLYTKRQVLWFTQSHNGKLPLKPWLGNKFWAYGMYDQKDDNNYKLFRFADALLMLAEVYMEKGDQQKACDYMNLTRTRAGLSALSPSSMGSGAEGLMEEIRCERARELFGEYQRKFDLVRWGIWYERTVAYNEGQFIHDYIRPCHRFWPIPAEQVTYSGGQLDNNEYADLI